MTMGESDAWSDKTEEERRGIISKYDLGRNAEIEPWDDPAFEIYHKTDYYGFIHDTRFPENLNNEENKQRKLEAERADKWIKMNAQWEKYKNSEKLRKRTFKGIPKKVRGLFWGHFLDLHTIKKQQGGKYEEMYNLARKHSTDVRQIDLDVNRTYRDHFSFRERYGVQQRSLFNVLCAYSVYNSEVGYCQGMSQVAALLLLFMEEESAFWGLSQLMSNPKYGMHGFFIAGFPKLVRFQTHHDKVLKAMLPKLKKHFDKHGVDVGLYTLKWFFQCFLDRVPFELALRLWDVFMLDGDKVLICGAYMILKIHQKQLLARKSMDDILEYFQCKIPSDMNVDSDKAMLVYQRCMEELQRKKLDTPGEPGEEEFPKQPFGLIENIIKPIPVSKPKPKIERNIVSEVPPTNAEPILSNETEVQEQEPDQVEVDISEKVSDSKVTVTSAASSSAANSPRNGRPLSSVSNFSYTSAIEESSHKSTPLKVNGIKSQTTYSNQDQENGSVETVDSMEFVVNTQRIVISNSEHLKKKFMEETMSGWDRNSSSAHKLNKIPPNPPTRSLDNVTMKTSGIHNIVHVDGNHVGQEVSISESSAKITVGGSPRTSHPEDVSSTSSIHIPEGTAVRIHVPYVKTTYSSSPASPSTSTTSASRSNFDTLKNDPNRIKIDISSK